LQIKEKQEETFVNLFYGLTIGYQVARCEHWKKFFLYWWKRNYLSRKCSISPVFRVNHERSLS